MAAARYRQVEGPGCSVAADWRHLVSQEPDLDAAERAAAAEGSCSTRGSFSSAPRSCVAGRAAVSLAAVGALLCIGGLGSTLWSFRKGASATESTPRAPMPAMQRKLAAEVSLPPQDWQGASSWIDLEDKCGDVGDDQTILNVITYNQYWWCVSNRYGNCGKFSNGNGFRELYSRIQLNHPFDLAGFQECDHLAQIVQNSGYANCFDSYAPHGAGRSDIGMMWNKKKFSHISHGNVVIAKDKYGERHLDWVRLQVAKSAKTVYFANTHGPLEQCWGEDGTQVANNYVNAINQTRLEQDITVFTGDFNCGSETTTMQQLRSLLDNGATGKSYDGADHIFTSGLPVLSRASVNGYPSDHELVKASFRLPVHTMPTSSTSSTTASPTMSTSEFFTPAPGATTEQALPTLQPKGAPNYTLAVTVHILLISVIVVCGCYGWRRIKALSTAPFAPTDARTGGFPAAAAAAGASGPLLANMGSPAPQYQPGMYEGYSETPTVPFRGDRLPDEASPERRPETPPPPPPLPLPQGQETPGGKASSSSSRPRVATSPAFEVGQEAEVERSDGTWSKCVITEMTPEGFVTVELLQADGSKLLGPTGKPATKSIPPPMVGAMLRHPRTGDASSPMQDRGDRGSPPARDPDDLQPADRQRTRYFEESPLPPFRDSLEKRPAEQRQDDVGGRGDREAEAGLKSDAKSEAGTPPPTLPPPPPPPAPGVAPVTGALAPE
eukprot:TRINITY_DN90891_c0_g1_i1.p1 TRINITY_DN90891_c0_g1~~TRINITY_DN90891_c0_g1_i1.p1  ORF type:complete len:723 (+),score=152.59 TRINITY_DN90891_c0_g1_i1:83-2251(+)